MFTKEVLKNGLRVILVPNQATNVVTVMSMFGVGSRQEEEKQEGISHVLEHMHYKGTKKRPTPMEVAEFIESIGGEHNAFTGKEYTGYYTKVASKHLESAFDFVSDLTINSKFDPNDLEREKGVIIEEINMYEDSPMDLVGSKFEEAIFGHNALGREIIGTKETVSNVTREQLVGYRDKYYSGPNTVLVLAGNFGDRSEAEILRLVEKYFSYSSGNPRSTAPVKLNQEKSSLIVDKKTEQSHLVLGFHGAPFAHPDRFKLKLLSVILGGSMSSRMFTEIREKRGLAYAVRSSIGTYSDAGTIETQVGVPHEKVVPVIEALLGEYRKVKEKEVGSAELNKAKEIVYGRLLISFEDSLDVASHFALGEITAEQTLTPEEMIREYEKISSSDIIETANKYLLDDKMALAYIGPALEKEELEKVFML